MKRLALVISLAIFGAQLVSGSVALGATAQRSHSEHCAALAARIDTYKRHARQKAERVRRQRRHLQRYRRQGRLKPALRAQRRLFAAKRQEATNHTLAAVFQVVYLLECGPPPHHQAQPGSSATSGKAA